MSQTNLEWQSGMHDRSPDLRHQEATPDDSTIVTVFGGPVLGYAGSVRIQLPHSPSIEAAKARAARVYAVVARALASHAAAVKGIDAALRAGEPLRHAVNEHDDCADWCRACAVEARARAGAEGGANEGG